MASPSSYNGVRYPDRAEALEDFVGYRVFLDPWEPIARELRRAWEALAIRGESHILAIHGQQGAGKTLFTKKIVTDWQTTRTGGDQVIFDYNNIWHRLSGGVDMKPHDILNATRASVLHEIENNRDWVKEAAGFLRGQEDRATVLIADNAERAYFRQGLVDMSDVEFIGLENSPGLNRIAAQRLVEQLRTTLRGSLLVILSNDELFLLSLEEELEKQHAGLITLSQLRLPDAATKETVVRVNTNRLNSISYWAAIDRSGADEKLALKATLSGESSFPDSFRAVDTAARNRTGRPARRNVITLVTMTDSDNLQDFSLGMIGEAKRAEGAHKWLNIQVFEEGWAPESLGTREARLLESEWVLRVCLVGDPFVRELLSVSTGANGNRLVKFFQLLRTYQGPGTQQVNRDRLRKDFENIVEEWPDDGESNEGFWNMGQPRGNLYEAALKIVLPGYDTQAEGFLTYRPDYVVDPFSPCYVTDALADNIDAIRGAIRRRGHVFEFTAIKNASAASIQSYLASKMANYVTITQEQ